MHVRMLPPDLFYIYSMQLTATVLDRDNKYARTLSLGKCCSFFRQQSSSRLNRNTAKAGHTCADNCLRADNRRINPELLPRLCDFHKHSADAATRQAASAADQRVRTFDSFHTKHQPLLNHNGLSNIKWTYMAQSFDPARDVAFCDAIWLRPRQ